jgi:hypothetical protein
VHEPEDPFVTLDSFISVEELELVRGMLESAGIECFSPDSQISRVYAGGIRPRLQVRSSQLNDARAILESVDEENTEDGAVD